MALHDEAPEVCQVLGPDDLPPTRLRVIGYWIDDDRPDLPDPATFIDPDWELEERQAVANYLHAGRPTRAGCGLLTVSNLWCPEWFRGIHRWRLPVARGSSPLCVGSCCSST